MIGDFVAEALRGFGAPNLVRSWWDWRKKQGWDLDPRELAEGFAGGAMGMTKAAPLMGKGIRAYHASPYDFDKFSMSKIGSGEGAQTYGHGLYFGGAKPTAQWYWDSFEQRMRPHSIKKIAEEKLGETISTDAARTIYRMVGVPGGAKLATWREPELRKFHIDKLHDVMEQIGAGLPKPKMYEVNIRARPEEFLDWDKPLSAQSPVVDPLVTLTRKHGIEGPLAGRSLPSIIYDLGHARITGSPAKASEAMKDAGIPGIRYLDQGSRAAGEGSHNYVLFRDDIIDILRKYGVFGVPAGVPMLPKGTPQSVNWTQGPF